MSEPTPPASQPPPEFPAGSAPVPPQLPPAFAAPDVGYGVSQPGYAAPAPGYTTIPYAASGYPVTGGPAPAYGGYGGYGGQPPAYYPAYAPTAKTNGLAIASMVVSIVSLALLPCYGAGGLLGIVGAILGHVSRRQIRDRQESGDGMAMAGVIIGWIATGIGVLIVGVIVVFVVWAVRYAPESNSSENGFDSIRLLLTALT